MNQDIESSVVSGSPPSEVETDELSNFELWGTLANTHYAILRSRFVEVGKLNLTPQKAQILHVIDDNGGSVLQNKISGVTMRRQHSVSDLVNRMVREGYITKKRLPNDRRYLITMKKKGESKYNQLTRQSVDIIFSVLTPQDCRKLNLVLHKLLKKASSLLGLDEKKLLLRGSGSRVSSVFDLWGLLAHTNFAISRLRFLEIADAGLTPEKAKILHIIHISGGSIPQNKISDITMRRQHSVSDLINRMVKEGLINKIKHPQDHVFIVKMSKKGRERYHCLKRNTLNIIFSVLTPEDRQNLCLALNKLLSKSRRLLGLDFTPPF